MAVLVSHCPAYHRHPLVWPTLLRGSVMRRIRCAIYTRKSSEDGLEQDFNSLDAQREACEPYIASQKHEGWELVPEHYDDGGISGGHLDRPALQRLMQAVDEKHVDQIVVYKIDRLTRSLADFAKLVDRLDAAETSFVSVTQSFNTATSMGRLTLNMLLSFAQFEREVTAERIRDKIAASKRKGMWMGGSIPLGYQPDGRTLKIDETEAETIRTLYDLCQKLGTLREVKEWAEELDLRSRRRERAGCRISGGTHFDRGHLQHILSNPVYAGRIRHKKLVYEGQHLTRPGAAAVMNVDLAAAELTDVSKRLQEQGNATERLALIERADLRRGLLTVRQDKAMLADHLCCMPEKINLAGLIIEAPFQMRRRGVELKLHLGEPPAEIDRTLVQNIMKGRSWLAMVIAGKTFSEIAVTEGVSKRRVQDVISLALLAPDVLDGIATGEQPEGLTTDYLIKTRFSAVWSEQRAQFASL